HDLYVKENPFQSNVESKVDASVNDALDSSVDACAKVSETLGLENPKSTENLGKTGLDHSYGIDMDVGTSAKDMIDSVVESIKGTIPETGVVPNVDTSVAYEDVQEQTIPDTPDHVVTPVREESPENMVPGNASDDNTVVNSQSDESMKTVSAHNEDDMSSEKDKDADMNIVDVDDLTSGERSIEKTPAPNIAKRLRSNSGKVVATASEPTNTTKKGKK
ncbi:hypothetical protein A2U01_0039692, partial [Trifolium medium]|nr:hypothetical protein [Trifolium medium]